MSSGSKLILCPYCGNTQTTPERCEMCGGLFEPLSRKATQLKMGPWFIRDKSNPFRPGCSYDVLAKQIKLGKIKPTTIIRGPSTHQFWSVARNVPGVAHLLGYCHRCGAHCNPDRVACPDCSEPFFAVEERNELGLMYRSPAAVSLAQKSIGDELVKKEGRQPSIGSQAGADAMSTAASRGLADGSPDASDESMGLHFDIDAKGSDLDMSDSNLGLLLDPPAGSESQARGRSPAAAQAVSKPIVVPADTQPDAASSRAVDPSATASFGRSGDPDTIKVLNASQKRWVVITWVAVLALVVNVITLGVLVPKFLHQKTAVGTAVVTPNAGTAHAGVDPARRGHPDAGPLSVDTTDTTGAGNADDPDSVDQRLATAPDVAAPSSDTAPEGQVLAKVVRGSPLATQLAEANELIKGGKPKEALVVLESIAKNVPKEQQPDGLNKAIEQLEEQIAHVEASNFFGIPLN